MGKPWSVDGRKFCISLIILSGALPALLGIVVIFSWHSHNETLIQVMPTFVPMQFNTALGFLISALTLIMAFRSHLKPAQIFGVLVAAIGLLTLIEYISGIDLRIDQFFMQHYITVETLHPGRMAPNTALCFLLTGIGLIAAARSRFDYQTSAIVGITGALVFGLGLIACSGYAIGLETAYGWGKLTRMAVHTSVGFIFLGVGLVAVAWVKGNEKTPVPVWLPFSVGISTFTISVSLWQALHAADPTGNSQYFVLLFGAVLSVAITKLLNIVKIACKMTLVEEKTVQRLSVEIRARKIAQAQLVEAQNQLEARIEDRTKELRESETRLLGILDNSPFGVSILSPTTKQRLYVNNGYVKIFQGVSSAQILGSNIRDSFVDPDNLENHWSELETSGSIVGIEEQRQRLDGTVFWCLEDWQILMFGGEKSIMIWHFDITERKQAEEQLDHKSELVELLRKTATDANKSLNFNAALQNCLSTIAKYTGWPVGHIYLMSEEEDGVLISSKIWHLDDPQRFATFCEITERTKMLPGQAFVSRVFATGKPLWIKDVTQQPTYSRKGQPDQDIQVRAGFALPVSFKDEIVAVLEFYTDKIVEQDADLMNSLVHIGTQLGRVFERKQAELGLRNVMSKIDDANRVLEKKVYERTFELKEAKVDAETANLTKSEFLANMSHELRTPLNAIIGFSEMIKGAMLGPLQPRYQDYAKDINVSGQHLLGIIADILDLSKVEAGKLDLDVEAIDVAETTAACKTMVGSQAEEAGVTLKFDVPTDLPKLYADPLRLKQILLNLIGNAIKFTPEGGLITVSGESNSDRGIVLRVNDTGIGIAKDDISMVMEKFGQVRAGHTQAHEGAGLGLALAKSLMERHGGELELGSELGKGTNITLTFPPDRTKSSPHQSAG